MSPSTSVIFSPEVDDRQLDREVSQVNEAFAETGQIDVQADSPELGTPEIGGGGRRGGGLGDGGMGKLGAIAGGVGGLASKIPASVGAVTASAALPVAMAGAVGLGIAKSLGGVSAQMASVNSMFGTALDIFFRPFGDFLGNELRPMAQDMIKFASDFSNLADSEGLAVAVASLPGKSAGALGSATLNLATGEGDLGDIALVSLFSGAGLTAAWLAGMLPSIGLGGILSGIGGSALLSYLPSIGLGSLLTSISVTGLLRLLPIISIGAVLGGMAGGALGEKLGHENIGSILGSLTGGALAGLLGSIGISGILSSLGTAGGSLAGLLGSVGLGAIVVGVGSIAALIAGIASLGDLVDGDISSWNLPAQFGHALGEGFARAWPDMAERIHTAFTNNPVYDAGEATREVMEGEGDAAVEGENRETSTALETGYVDPRGVPGLNQVFEAGQSTGRWIDSLTDNRLGGRVTKSGAANVHRGELIADPDRLVRELSTAIQGASGGGSGGTDVDMQETNDKLDRLHRDLQNLRQAFNVSLNVDGETLARTSENNRQEGLLDTDPTTG